MRHFFKKTGIITFSNEIDSFENFFEFSASLNVEDIIDNKETYEIVTNLELFHNTIAKLEKKYSLPKFSSIEWRPISVIDVVNEENARSLIFFAFERCLAVWFNYNLDLRMKMLAMWLKGI